VLQLSWNGSEYADSGAADPAGIPDIFSFTRADVMGKGTPQTLTIDRDGYLSVSTQAGETLWTSQESFGSTDTFLAGGSTDKEYESSSSIYINSRIMVLGTPREGRLPEILLPVNFDLSRGMLKRFRKFTSGHITAMAWNNAGMVKLWDSTTVDGYIADWGLEDMDGDGRPEIVYVNVYETGRIFKSKASVVVIEKL
jgi:hypothetical protein